MRTVNWINKHVTDFGGGIYEHLKPADNFIVGMNLKTSWAAPDVTENCI
jgi:hypothetical protein